MSDYFQGKDNEPNVRRAFVRFEGGAAAITKKVGRGLSLTRNGAGLVTITFNRSPGQFIGLQAMPAFDAAVPANVKSYIGIVGAYAAATKSIQLNLFEAGVLTDLAASEFCSLTLLFKADRTR
jgi:hypothetical protein